MRFLKTLYERPDSFFQNNASYMCSGIRNTFFKSPGHFYIPRMQFQDHQNTFENSSKIMISIFTVFYLQKGLKMPKNGSFLGLFFAIFSILGHDIKNRFQGRNNLPKYYKKHYNCFGITSITFEKIAKKQKMKKVANSARSHFSAGVLVALVHTFWFEKRSKMFKGASNIIQPIFGRKIEIPISIV